MTTSPVRIPYQFSLESEKGIVISARISLPEGFQFDEAQEVDITSDDKDFAEKYGHSWKVVPGSLHIITRGNRHNHPAIELSEEQQEKLNWRNFQ